jgi:outer membrane lipoprotein-sorting protein
MSDEPNETERQIEDYFAAERERLRAPHDLWSRIERQMTDTPPRSSASRLPAFAATIAIAIVLGVGAWFGLEQLGGGSTRSANDVLAAALEAAEHPESVGLRSFHGFAEFTYTEPPGGLETRGDDHDSEYEGVVRAEIPEEVEVLPEESTMEIWFGAPDDYRLERLVVDPRDSTTSTILIITDGTTDWWYRSKSNTYGNSPTEPPDSNSDFRVFLGPGSGVTSIEGLLAQYQNDPEHKARLSGERTIAGRRAYVLEISPAWTSSGPDGEDSGGVVRFWIDKQYLFAIGWEAEYKDGGVYGLRFRDIEFNGDLSADLFTFTPPPGATERDSFLDPSGMSGSSISSGDMGERIDLPAGFLTPAHLPAGYQARSHGSSYEVDDDGNKHTYRVDFLVREDDGDGYVSTQERRDLDALPGALKRGDEIDVLGNDAWLWTEDGLLHLAWQDGDLVVYMIARELSADELLRVAESMELSTGDDTSGSSEAVPVLPGE